MRITKFVAEIEIRDKTGGTTWYPILISVTDSRDEARGRSASPDKPPYQGDPLPPLWSRPSSFQPCERKWDPYDFIIVDDLPGKPGARKPDPVMRDWWNAYWRGEVAEPPTMTDIFRITEA